MDSDELLDKIGQLAKYGMARMANDIKGGGSSGVPPMNLSEAAEVLTKFKKARNATGDDPQEQIEERPETEASRVEHHVPGRFSIDCEKLEGVGSVVTITGETGELADAMAALGKLLKEA